MIRESTPLPRRPAHEAELIDDVLAVFHGRHLTSQEVVRFVNQRRIQSHPSRPPAAAVDIRMCLMPPYFRLTDGGRWKCVWGFPAL